MFAGGYAARTGGVFRAMSWKIKQPSLWTAEDKAERAVDWADVCSRFDEFPQVGVAFDGEPIRRLGAWGDGVKEKSGYVCSPVAYAVLNGSR